MDVGASSLEGIRVKASQVKIVLSSSAVLLPFLLASCASTLKYEKTEALKTNNEFEQIVKIEKPPEGEAATQLPVSAPPVPDPVKVKKETTKKIVKKSTVKQSASAKNMSKQPTKETVVAPAAAAVLKREPELEDSEGFAAGSRRPLQDPFRVGEVITHNVSYFKVSAGELKLKVEPFSQVNGKKAYTFATEIKTVNPFSSFYSVDDRVETLVDFDQLIPRVFALHVKESGQLRESRSFFDFEKGKATFWEKKVTKKDGEEEKKQEWDLDPFSQNVFSAVFYMRIFKWEVGKEYAFRVSDDEQNMVFKGTAIRKERLSTDAGDFDAVVIKPEVMLKGKFKPVGDNYIWLSDDDRKYVLRIEAKIKIGTLVSEVVKIEPGR